MPESKQLIADRVVSTANDIEDCEDYEALDEYLEPLSVKVTSNLEGAVSEVTLVVTVGGPSIEVECYSGVVRGSWGGETHSAPVFENEQLLEQLGARYERSWREAVR